MNNKKHNKLYRNTKNFWIDFICIFETQLYRITIIIKLNNVSYILKSDSVVPTLIYQHSLVRKCINKISVNSVLSNSDRGRGSTTSGK